MSTKLYFDGRQPKIKMFSYESGIGMDDEGNCYSVKDGLVGNEHPISRREAYKRLLKLARKRGYKGPISNVEKD